MGQPAVQLEPEGEVCGAEVGSTRSAPFAVTTRHRSARDDVVSFGKTVDLVSDRNDAAYEFVSERDRVSGQLTELGVSRDSFDEGFADSGQVTAERSEVEA